jgi:hypothetical protein
MFGSENNALDQALNCRIARRLVRARIPRARLDLLLCASRASLNDACAKRVRSGSVSPGEEDAFPRDIHSRLVIAMTANAVCPTSVGHATPAWPFTENPVSPSAMIPSS